MSDPILTPRKLKRSRIVEYLGVLVIAGIIVALAFYQEQIGYYFSLRLWNKAAPGQAVTQFLVAGKRGDQKQASSYLGTSELKPLTKDGKWVGYFLVSNAGTMDFRFDDLASGSEPQVQNTEFIQVGKGAADVTMTSAKGAPVHYRVEMKDNVWKITSISAGTPRRK